MAPPMPEISQPESRRAVRRFADAPNTITIRPRHEQFLESRRSAARRADGDSAMMAEPAGRQPSA